MTPSARQVLALPALFALLVAVGACGGGGGGASPPISNPPPEVPAPNPTPTPTAPIITTGPAAPTVTAGQTMTLQVAASGTAPLSYQWKRNGTDIPGATAATYSLPAVGWDDNGAVFSVTVSNNALPSGVTSDDVRLAMRPSTAGLVCSGTGSSNWCWANPQPTGLRLNGVTYAGSNLVATSYDGAIVRSADGGATWAMASTPADMRFSAVAFATATVGVAVGESGAIARSTDGGATWSPVASGSTGLFGSIAFANASIGVIAGGATDTVLRTTDGGATWIPVTINTNFDPVRLVAFNGSGGGVLFGTASAFVTSDNGVTWTRVPFSGAVLTSAAYASSDVVVAVAMGGVIRRSVDGGQTWASIPAPTIDSLHGVAFQSPTVGIAVGARRTIIRTVDGGANWSTIVPSDIANILSPLEGVAIRPDGLAVAVGGPGVTVRSADAGLTWTAMPSLMAVYWTGVAFADERYGVVVGRTSLSAAIARTQDGGRTWTPVNTDVASDLNAAAFASPTVGVAVGSYGAIRRTTDAGTTWTSVTSPMTNASLMSVTFLTSTVGIAIGVFPATILRTVDAGITWASVTPAQNVAPLWSIAAIDSNRVLAVGDDGGLVSDDGGATWTAVPAATGIGTQLRAVAFGDVTRGVVVASDGTIRRTSDGGTTWVASTSSMKLPSGSGVALRGTNGIIIGTGMTMPGTTYGAIQTTSDAAGMLTTVTSFPILPLRAVAMPSPTVGVVAGEYGVIAISNDGN